MAGGLKKGRPFEREVSKLLSLWWTNGETDDVFWVTAGSGARATIRRKVGKKTENSEGDIMALDARGKPLMDTFHLELKRGYTSTIDMIDFIDSGKVKKEPLLMTWWNKATDICLQNKSDGHCGWLKQPLIIFRRDKKLACILMHYKVYWELVKEYENPEVPTLSFIKDNTFALVTMKFEDFLEWIIPNPKFLVTLRNI